MKNGDKKSAAKMPRIFYLRFSSGLNRFHHPHIGGNAANELNIAAGLFVDPQKYGVI